MKTMINNQKLNEFLELLYPILPTEVDQWQAEICFKNATFYENNGILEITTKGTPSLMITKYGGYLKYIFPNKKIKFISTKGFAAMA
jgi:hypothetical protein